MERVTFKTINLPVMERVKKEKQWKDEQKLQSWQIKKVE
jgi:hypothetical protein